MEGTCLETYYCPNGVFLHVPPPFPDADWNYKFNKPYNHINIAGGKMKI